jgi:hypothetical protein
VWVSVVVDENVNVSKGEINMQVLAFDLPASLMDWFEICARRQGLTSGDAMTRLLEGLSGLELDDLKSLKEPPREPRRTSRFNVSRYAVQVLDETSGWSGLGRSVICRKVLYALLITRRVRIISDQDSGQFLLQATQLKFDFAKDDLGREKGAHSPVNRREESNDPF